MGRLGRPRLGPDLDDSAVLSSRGDHGLAFFDRAAGRLLDVDVLARLAGVHRLYSVPVVGRGKDHGVDVAPLEDGAIVTIGRHAGTGLLGGPGKPLLVDVADRGEIHFAVVTIPDHVIQVAGAHAADAHVGHRHPIVGPHFPRCRQNAGGHEVGKPHRARRRGKKLASLQPVLSVHRSGAFPSAADPERLTQKPGDGKRTAAPDPDSPRSACRATGSPA